MIGKVLRYCIAGMWACTSCTYLQQVGHIVTLYLV